LFRLQTYLNESRIFEISSKVALIASKILAVCEEFGTGAPAELMPDPPPKNIPESTAFAPAVLVKRNVTLPLMFQTR
jgi:hypothetical protein